MRKRKYPDPRTPVSVTHVGEFTVRVFDAEAYAESIRKWETDYVPPKRVAEWDLLDAEIAEIFWQKIEEDAPLLREVFPPKKEKQYEQNTWA